MYCKHCKRSFETLTECLEHIAENHMDVVATGDMMTMAMLLNNPDFTNALIVKMETGKCSKCMEERSKQCDDCMEQMY